jgi:putative ABC transport system ATP-binding protein
VARTETPPVAGCTDLVRIHPTASGESPALRGVGAHFESGTLTALTGPSGSGKSTLLELLALRDVPDSGEVWLRGRAASSMTRRERRRHGRRTIAWMPQRATDGVFGHLTALQNVVEASARRDAARRDGADLLARLGLEARTHVLTSQLSGGEQQRVALVRACVGAPPLILCDEPTAELDEETAALALAVLRGAADSGSAVVVASHDPAAVAACDRIIELRHGVLASEQSAGAVALSAIDGAGRVQLPEDALRLFPDGRLRVVVDGRRVVLEPPAPTS